MADGALDSVMEFNKNNLELRSKKQMVHVNGMNPHDHGLNVIQVNASRFQKRFMHMRCIIKNQDNEVLTTSCSKNFITVEPSIAELLAIQ